MELDKIYNEDCQEGIKRIPDASIDCILTDPPYLYLKGHKLDRPFDERALFEDFKRVLKPTGFVVLFGRGTSFYRWNNHLSELGFVFKGDIVWNKRRTSSPVGAIGRVHESVSIHTKNSGVINKVIIDYAEAKGYDLDKIETDLRRLGGLFNKGKAFDKVCEGLRKIERGEDYSNGNRGNGYRITCQSALKNRCVSTYTINSMINGVKEQSIITDSSSHYGNIHPTQKPVRLLSRLLDLVSQPGDIVLDLFSGSCSTAVACINTGRKFIGFEIDSEYYEAGTKRLNEALSEPKLAM